MHFDFGVFMHFYIDFFSISGTKKDKRPALMQMMSDCDEGKIDFIVTKSLSRIARKTTDC